MPITPTAEARQNRPALSTVSSPSARHYEQHRDYVLSVLGRRCGWLDRPDREAILHDAYAVLLEKQRDGAIDIGAMHDNQVRAYLTQTALNKALDEGKKVRHKRSVALEDGGLQIPVEQPDADELLNASYEGARLREIVAELPERQQVVVKLRFFFDRSPQEIQSYLSITERVYRRELERAMRALSGRFELVREGTFCESRRSLILAFVSGISGPNRAIEAQRHLASCPACARWAVELRETARQAGAIVPLPLLTVGLDQHGDRLASVAHAVGAVRDRIAELLGSAREQATAIALRTDVATPSVLAGARPGALVAVVAGCLTVGSTATYCVIEGVPGLSRGATTTQERSARPAAVKRPAAVRTATTTRAAATTTPARTTKTTPTRTTTARKSTTSTTKRATTKVERQRAKAKQQERATAPEFGVEGSGSSAAAAPVPSTPAPSSTGSGSTSGSSSSPSSGSSSGSSSGGGWSSEFGP